MTYATSPRKQKAANKSDARAALKLDNLDLQLVAALQEDSRRSLRELARHLGVSAPTVSDRLNRLEDVGVICGYSAEVNPELLGIGVLAYVGVLDTGQKFDELDRWAAHHPDVLECHHLTGRFAALMKVAVRDIAALNDLVMELINKGVQCDTSVVLKTAVSSKQLNVGVAT